MSIKDGKVAARDLWVKLEVLHALVRVLHAFSLAYVADYARIVPLDLEFERADPEGVIRLQAILFVALKAPIDTARLKAVDAAVLYEKRAQDGIVD